MLSRFPIAVKGLKGSSRKDIDLLLDEARCMVKVGKYHQNIVNLQGVSYKVNQREKTLEEVKYYAIQH